MQRRPGAGRSALGAVLAAVLAVTLSTSVAVASVGSSVSLTIKNGHIFHGRVTSASDKCVVGRKVRLIRIEPDDSRTAVETTFATESGHYSASIPLQSGNHFYARIRRLVTPTGTVCRADNSVVRTV